jgi:hypothetical protein
MWAIDGGMKWRGLAINGQYYFRWLNAFEADGFKWYFIPNRRVVSRRKPLMAATSLHIQEE